MLFCICVSENPMVSCPHSVIPVTADSTLQKGWGEVSEECKRRMAEVVLQDEDIFLRHPLDCGKAIGFVHPDTLLRQKTIQDPLQKCDPWTVPKTAPGAEWDGG